MSLTKTQIANRKKLITALRSGKYNQGRGTLRSRDNEFCCQGVACHISGKGQWKTDFDYYVFEDTTGDMDESSWPKLIQNSLGFTDKDSDTFMTMNDIVTNGGFVYGNENYTLREGCTFEEIADAMEYLTLAGL